MNQLKTFLFLFGVLLVGSLSAQQEEDRKYILEEEIIEIPDTNQVKIVANRDLILCGGVEVILSTSFVADSYQWLRNDSLWASTESTLTTTLEGRYQVQVMRGDSTLTSEVMKIETYPLPDIEIVQENDVLTAVGTAQLWQWYYNGEAMEDTNYESLVALESGRYAVEITDKNTCTNRSKDFELTIASIHEVRLQALQVYPIPARQMIYVTPINIENQDFILSLFDIGGQLVYQQQGRLHDNEVIQVDIQALPAGMYLLRFSGEEMQSMERVFKN